MTAAVRFRGRKKPAYVQRVANAEIESESDAEVARALHVRAIQRIRRQFCSTVVEDPEPLQESNLSLLCHNFKTTEEKISPVSLHLQNSARKRSRSGQTDCNNLQSNEDAHRKQSKTIPHSETDLDIQEYHLPIEEKIKNIEATESAKQAAMKKLAINAVNKPQSASFNSIPVNVGCNFQQYENEPVYGNIRYAASDEFLYQQFRKRVN